MRRLLITTMTSLLLTACVPTPSPDEMKQVAERNRWELAHWGDRAIPYTNEGQPVVLAFQEGRVSGHAGCNRYSTAISFGPNAGEVTVSHGITTRMACEPRRMEFEAAFIKAFEASSRYRLDGESLSFESDIAPPLEFYRRPLTCHASPFSACAEQHDSSTPR
ncbi:MAG: META domain-containing protein [Nitrospira sp.]|nr:META domain-containing protein [Nitrospira sp.]